MAVKAAGSWGRQTYRLRLQILYKVWKTQTLGALYICPDLSCDTFTFGLPLLIFEYRYFKMSEVKVRVKLSHDRFEHTHSKGLACPAYQVTYVKNNLSENLESHGSDYSLLDCDEVQSGRQALT